MQIEVKSIQGIFDEWARDLKPTKESIDHYGFELRVVCSKDIPPRHCVFDFIRGMGINKFDEIFSGTLSSFPEHWMMAFPERYCSVQEIYRLIYEICELNRSKNLGLKRLDILTSSPAILSDTMNGCLTIISFPEGQKSYAQSIF